MPEHAPRLSLAGWAGDFRLAVRASLRKPLASIAVVLTVALGVGATTATFGVFNLVVFRPIPGVADTNRIVSLYVQPDAVTPTRTGVSFAHFQALRRNVPALEDVAAFSFDDAPFSTDLASAVEMVGAVRVSSAYFDALGARPRLGRLPSAAEPDAFADPIVVVSEHFWRQRLNADPAAVGRVVYFNGRPFVVSGVVAGFRGTSLTAPDDLWVPIGASWTADPPNRTPGVLQFIARLHGNATREQAQAQALAAWHAAGDVVVRGRGDRHYVPVIFPGLTDGVGLLRQRLLNVFWILEGGMGMLLLLACANAANLLITRNVRRGRDLALRRALGASRGRLIRLLLIEAVAEAGLAAALGLALARLFMELFRGTSLLSGLPALVDLTLDWRVAGLAVAVSVLTMVTCAVLPAWMAARVDPLTGLRGGGRATRTTRVRNGLVAVQFAFSLTLLVSAGVLLDTVAHLRSVDLGFRPDGLVGLSLSPTRLGYHDDQIDRVFEGVRSRVLEMPGIASAAITQRMPLDWRHSEAFRVSDADTPLTLGLDLVSPGYFETMRIALDAGRSFTASDTWTDPVTPIVISRLAALKLFRSLDVLGKVVLQGASQPRALVVVGLVGDIRRDLRADFDPTIYEPASHNIRMGTVVVRSALPTADVVETVRRAIHDVDPALPIGETITIPAQVDEMTSVERLLARLGAVAAALASVLAAGGLYALISFAVAERTRELGIRIALGASGGKVVRNVMGGVIGIGGAGLAIGILLLSLASHWLSSRLFGVTAFDPPAVTAAVLLLAGVATLASSLPARRASKVNPVDALRVD